MVIDITPAPILSKGWGTPTNAALETLAAQAQTADEVTSIASAVADAKFAEVSVDLVDATMTATAETPSSDFAQHLNGTIGAVGALLWLDATGARRVVPAPVGDEVAVVEMVGRGNRPYFFHLIQGIDSAAGNFSIAFGNDRGSGGAVLIAGKNAGAGAQVINYAGAGIGIYLQNYSANAGLHAEVFANAGGIVIAAKDGEAFRDGFTTAGSTVFTSATAAFTVADNGRTVVQQSSRDADDPFGCIPAGTTITYVNATTVTLSQPAGATAAGTGLLFRIAGRPAPANQKLIDVLDTDGASVIARLRRNALAVLVTSDFTAGSTSTPAMRVHGKTGHTANIMEWFKDGTTTPADAEARIGPTGKIIGVAAGYFSNARDTGTTALTVQSAAAAIRAAVIIGAAGQSADVLTFLDSGSAVKSRFDKDGYFITKMQTAIADAQLVAGEIAFYFDSTTGAPKPMVKMKDAAGTVVRASLNFTAV